ncbi:MAG: hypothetical protein IJN21_03825 [Clostridia bacterium]|nr:hypothetical protein [Clostridia bacterium]
MLTKSENIKRTILFQGNEWIPCDYVINPSYFFYNDAEEVLDLMARHPALFPGFVRPEKGAFLEDFRKSLPSVRRFGKPYVDDFGCTWETPMEGMTGTVTKHPLSDLNNFNTYVFPDPAVCMGIGPIDWEAETKRIQNEKAAGNFIACSLRHGHTFLQLTDLCGYQNFTYFMEDEEPELDALIDGITAFNMEIIRRYLEAGADMICIPEDLGMQSGPMISVKNFRKYIKPAYQKMMDQVRSAGKLLHMHSDGDIRSLAFDIIDGGCQVLNLQDLVNGIDWIRDNLKGKVCIELDIDRQKITYSGSPKDIDDLIREEVEKLSSPSGGLMLIYGLYPGTSIENAEAVARAMEKYALGL